MTDSTQPPNGQPSCVEDETGPWPFVTRRVYRTTDGSRHIWDSRSHRKGLLIRVTAKAEGIASQLLRGLWMPAQLNWWIGTIFALGSLLFVVASVLSLSPSLAAAWSLDSAQINAIYFAGSIPFTTAAYLQLFQAANAGDRAEGAGRLRLIGWQPQDIGWLSCVSQFVGTILFNFNTFDAMLPMLNWFKQDLLVWAPNIIGSVLFLTSGYLAFVETCHAHWAWKPNSLSWWVVFINLLGCLGFIVAAILAIVVPGTPDIEIVHVSVFFTLAGAACFLVGSLLMLPETACTQGSDG